LQFCKKFVEVLIGFTKGASASGLLYLEALRVLYRLTAYEKPGFARLRGFAYPYLKPLRVYVTETCATAVVRQRAEQGVSPMSDCRRRALLGFCKVRVSRHKARGVQDCDPLTARRASSR